MGKTKRFAAEVLREMRGLFAEKKARSRTTKKKRKRKAGKRHNGFAVDEYSGDIHRLRAEPKRRTFDHDVEEYFGLDFGESREGGLPNFNNDSDRGSFPFAPSKKELKEIFRL